MDVQVKEKYIQAVCAAYWMVSYLILPLLSVGLLFYVAFFTAYSHLSFLYMCWAYFDKETPYKGGRKIPFLRKFLYWKYFNDYFPIQLIKTADLNGDKNYLFGYYPHGVLPAGMFGCFGNDHSSCKELFPELNVYCATLDINFNIPVFREYCMGIGGISSSKESIKYVLDDKKKGNVAVLAIGGAAESFYATPGPYRIVLKNRRGFVKIALEQGASLVPVFAFGEIDLYKQYNPPGSKLYKFQNAIKKYIGFAPLVPVGRGIFINKGLAPFNSPVNVVVGKAIDVPKIPYPTDEEIEKYHTQFSEELITLFNEHKDKYTENGELVIQ
ncbi:2-acylglycerol O-acyltransferase 1 [Halyomorpha halys]|uniref:2-acylglycerol O-acyltransferase 1 n=1 Tax=Halyomorpha halys TaxID=286706 RepID=UPI0006D50B57|nr:2-acylglycerol O-acyltransferase 1-like [Halyomorpha halys]